MFDSLIIDCPKGHKMEFQSKSGECWLSEYDSNNITTEVAAGMADDIARCDYCKKNYQLKIGIPKLQLTIKLKETKKKKDYMGNYKK